jgi:hypothetical protein
MIKLYSVILFFIIIQNYSSLQTDPDIIIDSNYSFNESVSGKEIPKSILNQLKLLDVEYFSFDNKLHRGQILINKKVTKDIKDIFQFIKTSKFPVEKIIPIVKYNWSDETSMLDNNTSAFNYRLVDGNKVLSLHAYGLAIDINPIQNPFIKNGIRTPATAKYDEKAVGTITRNSDLVKEFKKRGWMWGGLWLSGRDYQHFEKIK